MISQLGCGCLVVAYADLCVDLWSEDVWSRLVEYAHAEQAYRRRRGSQLSALVPDNCRSPCATCEE